MPEHFGGLTGAAILNTQYLQLASHIISDVVEDRLMGAMWGVPGSGKTFAVETTLEDLAGQLPEVCMYASQNQPTMRAAVSDLWAALTGTYPPRSKPKYVINRDLQELLAGPERLIIVDEAQRLNTEALEELRDLHDSKRTRFSLLFVGGDGCWEALSSEQQLRSRISRRLHFQPLRRGSVPDLIRQYHPLYGHASDDILLLIDDRYARGCMREWANFTKLAARVAETAKREGIDKQVTLNTLAMLGGEVGG